VVKENTTSERRLPEASLLRSGAGFFGNQISDSPGFVYRPSRGGFVLLVGSFFGAFFASILDFILRSEVKASPYSITYQKIQINTKLAKRGPSASGGLERGMQ
jgi:hypothetical protein